MQDLERVGGASGREGLQRTAPRWEKWVRPLNAVGTSLFGDCGKEVVVVA